MADPSVSIPITHKGKTIGHVLRRMDDGTIDGYDGEWSLWAEYRSVQEPHQVELGRGFYKSCEDVGGNFQVELLAIAVSEGGYRTFIVRKMAQDDPLRQPFCAGLVNQSGGLTIKASSRVAGVEAGPPNTLLLGLFLKSKSVAQHKRARVTIREKHGVIRQEGQGEKARRRRRKRDGIGPPAAEAAAAAAERETASILTDLASAVGIAALVPAGAEEALVQVPEQAAALPPVPEPEPQPQQRVQEPPAQMDVVEEEGEVGVVLAEAEEGAEACTKKATLVDFGITGVQILRGAVSHQRCTALVKSIEKLELEKPEAVLPIRYIALVAPPTPIPYLLQTHHATHTHTWPISKPTCQLPIPLQERRRRTSIGSSSWWAVCRP
jgi:hypothetical protein